MGVRSTNKTNYGSRQESLNTQFFNGHMAEFFNSQMRSGKGTNQGASYTVTQDQTTRDEGETVTFNVNTTGLPNAYTLYWTTKVVSGTVNASDFTDNAIQGTVQVNATGQASIARTISNDASTEGTEKFTIEIRDGGYSSPVVAEGETVTISDTSTAPVYASLVQGAYSGSTITGLTWSGSSTNNTGGVSSIAIPTNRKTYIEIFWGSNGGGNPGPGVTQDQNTEIGMGSPKGWWRNNGSMEASTWSFTDISSGSGTNFSTGAYLGIAMDNSANSGSGKITYYRNGTAIFEGGSGWTSNSSLYFHWQNNGSGTSSGTFNFGATSFQYPVSGFGGLYS